MRAPREERPCEATQHMTAPRFLTGESAEVAVEQRTAHIPVDFPALARRRRDEQLRWHRVCSLIGAAEDSVHGYENYTIATPESICIGACILS
jgi:predicted transcriptional regulator